jgi:hypothetical protein
MSMTSSTALCGLGLPGADVALRIDGKRRKRLRIVEESVDGKGSVAEVARRSPQSSACLATPSRSRAVSAEGGLRARFAPVAVENRVEPPVGSGGGSAIEVMLRNGRALRLPDGRGPAWVAGLADALEGDA